MTNINLCAVCITACELTHYWTVYNDISQPLFSFFPFLPTRCCSWINAVPIQSQNTICSRNLRTQLIHFQLSQAREKIQTHRHVSVDSALIMNQNITHPRKWSEKNVETKWKRILTALKFLEKAILLLESWIPQCIKSFLECQDAPCSSTLILDCLPMVIIPL